MHCINIHSYVYWRIEVVTNNLCIYITFFSDYTDVIFPLNKSVCMKQFVYRWSSEFGAYITFVNNCKYFTLTGVLSYYFLIKGDKIHVYIIIKKSPITKFTCSLIVLTDWPSSVRIFFYNVWIFNRATLYYYYYYNTKEIAFVRVISIQFTIP